MSMECCRLSLPHCRGELVARNGWQVPAGTDPGRQGTPHGGAQRDSGPARPPSTTAGPGRAARRVRQPVRPATSWRHERGHVGDGQHLYPHRRRADARQHPQAHRRRGHPVAAVARGRRRAVSPSAGGRRGTSVGPSVGRGRRPLARPADPDAVGLGVGRRRGGGAATRDIRRSPVFAGPRRKCRGRLFGAPHQREFGAAADVSGKSGSPSARIRHGRATPADRRAGATTGTGQRRARVMSRRRRTPRRADAIRRPTEPARHHRRIRGRVGC
jgi:hypothetical protein